MPAQADGSVEMWWSGAPSDSDDGDGWGWGPSGIIWAAFGWLAVVLVVALLLRRRAAARRRSGE